MSEAPDKAPPSPHLVLVTYSATSHVLMAALWEWKNRATAPRAEVAPRYSSESEPVFSRENGGRTLSEEEAERLLRRALTVVTISALSQGFMDGPAYVHVSMDDDALASTLGVSKANSAGGGEDAVFLQALSPYKDNNECPGGDPSNNAIGDGDTSSKGVFQNDAHNINACVIQYLSLVRRINGVTSFREMYDLGAATVDQQTAYLSSSYFAFDYRSVGQLAIPPRIDADLIPAMVRATGGEAFLWSRAFQLGGEGADGAGSPLPSPEDARAELENQLGYHVYDDIVESFSAN
jgi:hypothetical protein